MSFSVYCNSLNGTQVAGAMNSMTYNFDWAGIDTDYEGAYKVSFAFASETQTYIPASSIPARLNIDLGIINNFVPNLTQTRTAPSQILGIIRPSVPLPSLTTSATGTPLITTYTYLQTLDAKFCDNAPVILLNRPRNNNFNVRITDHNSVPYTYLTAHYILILHFEPVDSKYRTN